MSPSFVARAAYLLPRFLALPLIFLPASCGTLSSWTRTAWVYDYESAERRAGQEKRAILIYYGVSRPGTHDPLRELLGTGDLQARTRDFVRCRLYQAHEPDRRFVAQYGVTRAPAWIVIHADGTYHARMGKRSGEEVAAFLEQATPPGATPDSNPFLARSTPLEWLSDVETAERAAGDAGRPLLVVYSRMLSRDGAKLEPLWEANEVRRLMVNMVPCRVDIMDPWRESEETRFGRLRLPAVVLVEPDGRHSVLERPGSARSLARFLRSNHREATVSGAEAAATATE